ncbi:MAG: TonB-dependent receptor [Steroidobacteraceae bacterium]|jgi:iron complex outermembrane receptor protein|nr:TonB-dependent receptor [Steroidobacteraceae bacterium]
MTAAPSRPAVRLAVALALAAGAGTAGPAYAQDGAGAGTLEEIVVTAQRREESLMTVPIAVSAIGGEALQRQNVDSVEDVLAQVPNVSFVSLGSRDRKEVSMRGVSNQLNPFADSRQSPYGFYIDEFSVAVGTSNPEILDIERIEVLRGPQGTYFGRNAVGGAINVITRKPTNEWASEVGASVGNYGSWGVHAIVNAPIVDEKLALRASAQTRRTDGWIENIHPVGGGNDGRFDAARATLRFKPTDRLTWDLNYSTMEGEEGMRVGVPTGFLTQTWRNVYYGGRTGFIANPDGVGFFPDNTTRVNFNRPQSVGSSFDYVSTRATYDFDAMTLTIVGGSLESEVYNFGDVDGGSIDAFYEELLIERESKSGEIRLQSRGERRLEWSIGAFVGEDRGVLIQPTFHGTQSPLNRPAGVEVTGTNSDTTNEYWAVFAQATWHFTDSLNLILGGRYSTEDVRTVGQSRSNGAVTGTNNRSSSFNDFSPRATLSWQPLPGQLLYATASKGFKAGGTQTTGTVQLRNEFDPEELWNYELGWKGELLDRRLRVDLSTFYMDWKNVQQFVRFQFINPVTGQLLGATGIDNASKATVKGIDFSTQMAASDQLRLGASVGYLDATYGRWQRAFIDGAFIDASGKRLINAPRWTLGAHGEYSAPVFGYDGFARVEWNRRSSQLSNTFALRYEFFPFIAPSYGVVNVRFGVEGERWKATAYVENLFDERFFTNSYEKAFYSGVQVETNVRHVGLEVQYRFGGTSTAGL